MECWLPDAIKELRPDGRGRRKRGDNMDPGTRRVKRLPPGGSDRVLSEPWIVLFCVTRSSVSELRRMSRSDKANDKSESQRAILGHADPTECWGKVLLNMGAPGSGWRGASV